MVILRILAEEIPPLGAVMAFNDAALRKRLNDFCEQFRRNMIFLGDFLGVHHSGMSDIAVLVGGDVLRLPLIRSLLFR